MGKAGFLTCVLLFALAESATSQFDTVYVSNYRDRLAVSIIQTTRRYDIWIEQGLNPDSAGKSNLNYAAEASATSGFGLSYDKVSFAIGFRTPQDDDEKKRKGTTRTLQFNAAITGARLRMEGSYRYYKGFYDAYSSTYLPAFTDSTPFFQNPDLRNTSVKLKAFYFFNFKKRFSYGAAYQSSLRQVKSAGSPILSANLYTYNLVASGSIVPPDVETFYAPWQRWDEFRITAISLGIGYTHTFVIFKRVFLNLLLTAGAEEQRQVLKTGDASMSYDKWKLALSSYDFRASLGFNARNFFLSLQTIVDGNGYEMPGMSVQNQFTGGLFVVGYRFGLRPPVLYRKIQETGLYRSL